MFEQHLDYENHAPLVGKADSLSCRIQRTSETASCTLEMEPKERNVSLIASLAFSRILQLAFGIVLVVCVFDGSPHLYAQDAEVEEPQLVYPNSSSEKEANEGQSELYQDLLPEGGSGVGMVVTILGYLIIVGGLCVAAWYLFKRGVIRKPFSSSEGKLKVAESRMLGNRQYIMVVEYEDKKILLGVGPGKIDYLTSLDGYKSDFPKIEPELERVSVQELA